MRSFFSTPCLWRAVCLLRNVDGSASSFQFIIQSISGYALRLELVSKDTLPKGNEVHPRRGGYSGSYYSRVGHLKARLLCQLLVGRTRAWGTSGSMFVRPATCSDGRCSDGRCCTGSEKCMRHVLCYLPDVGLLWALPCTTQSLFKREREKGTWIGAYYDDKITGRRFTMMRELVVFREWRNCVDDEEVYTVWAMPCNVGLGGQSGGSYRRSDVVHVQQNTREHTQSCSYSYACRVLDVRHALRSDCFLACPEDPSSVLMQWNETASGLRPLQT